MQAAKTNRPVIQAAESFQQRWNASRFYTDDDRFEIYKLLEAKGSRFEDLDFLDGLLHYLDSRNQPGSPWRKKTPSAFSSRVGPGPLTLFGYQLAIQAEDESLEFVIPNQPHLRLRARREKKAAKLKSLLRAFGETNRSSLAITLLKYATRSLVFGTGQRSDDHGNLVLTVMIEYFNQTTGKPRWQEAGRLFRIFRTGKDYPEKSLAGYSLRKLRSATQARVAKFKKANPDWQKDVRAIMHELRKTRLRLISTNP